jgi:hypothetical protein
MERSSPQIYIIIQASNGILSNMKVEDLDLTFPKSPRTCISHMWLANYDQIIFKKSWTSRRHNFHTIWPIHVILFWANSIWHALSWSIITFHQISSQKCWHFHLNSIWILEGKCSFEIYALLSLPTNFICLQTDFWMNSKPNSGSVALLNIHEGELDNLHKHLVLA